MFSEKEQEEIMEYLIDTPGKVYLGGDSQRFKKNGVWYARYTCVFIVHINNQNGGKIFYYSEVERDFDQQNNKPRMRLMNEVHKIVNMYLQFGELLEDREVQIHLDINSDQKHNSNLVMKEAMGYVKGVTGIDAKVKPQAWAAAHAADAGVRGRFES